MWPHADQSLQRVGQQQGRVWDRWNGLFSPSPSLVSLNTTPQSPGSLSPVDPPCSTLTLRRSDPHSFVRARWATISDTQQMHTHLCFPVPMKYTHKMKTPFYNTNRLGTPHYQQCIILSHTIYRFVYRQQEQQKQKLAPQTTTDKNNELQEDELNCSGIVSTLECN